VASSLHAAPRASTAVTHSAPALRVLMQSRYGGTGNPRGDLIGWPV
jgi:hypothetical protein